MGLGFRALYDQLVVDLEYQSGLQPGLGQSLVHPEHGQLDDIRGGTLDGGVHSHPLGGLPHHILPILQLGQIAPTPVEGGDVAQLRALLDHGVHKVPHSVILAQIAVNIVLGFGPADADILSQGKLGDPVDDAEIDGLGAAPHLGRHFLKGYAKDLRGRHPVDVLPGVEGGLHGRVAGHVGQNAQLDLAVICVHEDPAGLRDEHLPDLRTQVRPYGNILEIGLRGGQTARCGDGVLEGGAHAPVGADDLKQTLGVGGLELGEGPVFENSTDDRVFVAELFQYLRVGGPAGFGFLPGGQSQPLKKHLAQLLGGVEIEVPACVAEDLLLRLYDAGFQHLVKGVERVGVHPDALYLHLCQHCAEGQVHFIVEFFQILGRQTRLQGGAERQDEPSRAKQRGVPRIQSLPLEGEVSRRAG